MGLRLVERDYRVMEEVQRWRFCLGRQLRVLTGFNGQRATDRRLAKLIEAGYLERRYLVYGIPGLYFITRKAKDIFNLEFLTENVRLEQIQHDIYVIDTAIYFMNTFNIESKCITTERQLKHNDGFGKPKHRPDFIFSMNDTVNSVEIELSAKKITTLEKNVKDNYLNYEEQFWIVPDSQEKIINNLNDLAKKYQNIKIISLDTVIEYVKNK